VIFDLVFGAIAVAVFVFLVAAITSLAGASDPARRSWALFLLAGLLLFFAFAQRNPLLFGGAIGGVAATSAFVWWAARRNRRRDQIVRAVGTELGLSYEEEPASTELRDLASELTSAGNRNAVQRVLAGRWRGNDGKLFDYGYELDTPRGGGVERNFTCALVAIPLDSEPVTITTETFLTRVAAKVGYRDIQLGDADFDRVFNVRSKNPAAALSVLGPAVRSWLGEHGRGLNFLIGRGAVLGMATEGTASRAQLLELVTALRGLLAGPAGTDIPTGPELDRRALATTIAVVDPHKAVATRRTAVGVGIVVLVPLALVAGAYVLLYAACATGNGCL
jgi:hypothetical protein